MKVIEAFGPTIQGEGQFIGCASHFVRLAGCNQRCAWCDTAYAQAPDSHEVREWSNSDFMDWVVSNRVRRLVITGGEPLIQMDGLFSALFSLPDSFPVTVETNGTILGPVRAMRALDNVLWSISPKLPSSGCYVPLADLPCYTLLYEEIQTQWKFVVSNVADGAMLLKDLKATDLGQREDAYQNQKLIIQPNSCGEFTYKDLIVWVRDNLWARGVDARVLPQAHVLAFGQQRGV